MGRAPAICWSFRRQLRRLEQRAQMMWFFKTRSAAVWLLLVVVTLLSWESAVVISRNPHIAAICVLLLAFFKVRLIGLEFMELRTAPPWLRMAFEMWVVSICAVLLTLYWQAVA
jgi:hypothetical protein